MTVSIIIPVFNVAPYLRACLDSIAAAVTAGGVEVDDEGGHRTDKFSVEVICVDDGSTDGSGAILDEYARPSTSSFQHLAIKVIHQANAGVSVARNAALDIATGDWLLFVDADDRLAVGALTRISGVLRQDATEFEFLAFGSIRFRHDADIPTASSLSTDVEYLDYPTFIRRGVHRRNIWEGCYSREAFGDLRFRAGLTMGEDKLYQAGVFGRVKSIAFIRDRLYCYRIRQGSAVNSPVTVRKLVDRVDCRLAIDGIFDAAHRCPVGDERAHVLYMTEGFSRDYFGLCKAERKIVKPHWDRMLTHYLRRKSAPLWCRFAAWCSLAFRFDWVRFVLFRVPFYLKQKGIHRRRMVRR